MELHTFPVQPSYPTSVVVNGTAHAGKQFNQADMMYVDLQVGELTISSFEPRGILIHYFPRFLIFAFLVINLDIRAQRPHVNDGKLRVDIISGLHYQPFELAGHFKRAEGLMKGVCRHGEPLWDEELQATGCTDDGTDPSPPPPPPPPPRCVSDSH